MRHCGFVISGETQYLIYAGLEMDDFTGWRRLEDETDANACYWALDLGRGCVLHRAVKKTKGLFGVRTSKLTSLKFDWSAEDPDGDFLDACVGVIHGVKYTVEKDCI